MKKLFTGNYTLDVPTRTITLTDIALSPEQVLMVTNVTAGHVYHMFTSETPANISVVGGDTRIVFQPFKDCDAHNNTDRLSIYIEDGEAIFSEEDARKIVPPYEFLKNLTLSPGVLSEQFIVSPHYPAGTVFLLQGNFPIGTGPASAGWTLTTGNNISRNFFIPGQDAPQNVVSGNASIFFRKEIGDPPAYRLVKGAASASLPGFVDLYVYKELDFGTGFPHINSISTLVYPLDNNLKVSDFQSQVRLGGVADAPATSDNPNDKGLIPLVKRLLGTKLPDKNSDGRIPVDIGGSGSITVTSGTITVSNEVEVTNAVGNPIPVSGPLTDAELRDSPVPVSGAHGAINTSSAELTTSNSVEVLAASSAATPRRYLFLQNLSTAPIYVNFTNNATATSMRLDAGSSLAFEGNFVPNNSVNLLRSTTTNQRYLLMHATY